MGKGAMRIILTIIVAMSWRQLPQMVKTCCLMKDMELEEIISSDDFYHKGH